MREVNRFEREISWLREAVAYELPGLVLAVEDRVELRVPKPFVVGPVEIYVTFRLFLRGKATRGKPLFSLTATPGNLKADFTKSLKTSYGTAQITGSIDRNKKSTLRFSFGEMRLMDVDFKAGVDLSNPFQVEMEVSKELLSETFKFGDWTYTGLIKASVKAEVKPSPLGWAALTKGGLEIGRGVLATGKGLLFSESLGTATALGAAAVGGGVLLSGLGFLAYVLHKVSGAHEQGTINAMDSWFREGYADGLVSLTQDHPIYKNPSFAPMFARLSTLDWRNQLEESKKAYLVTKGKDESYGLLIAEAGKAALVEDFMEFVNRYGEPAWQKLSAIHSRKYGPVWVDYFPQRRNQYLNIMRDHSWAAAKRILFSQPTATWYSP